MPNPLKRIPWRKVLRWAGKTLLNAGLEKGRQKIEQVEREKPEPARSVPQTRSRR